MPLDAPCLHLLSQVWFDRRPAPFSARLPFWLDPPPVAPLAPATLMPSRTSPALATTANATVLANLGRGRGSLQRVESLMRESQLSPPEL